MVSAHNSWCSSGEPLWAQMIELDRGFAFGWCRSDASAGTSSRSLEQTQSHGTNTLSSPIFSIPFTKEGLNNRKSMHIRHRYSSSFPLPKPPFQTLSSLFSLCSNFHYRVCGLDDYFCRFSPFYTPASEGMPWITSHGNRRGSEGTSVMVGRQWEVVSWGPRCNLFDDSDSIMTKLASTVYASSAEWPLIGLKATTEIQLESGHDMHDICC